jgi:small subunit ribosomal protein S9e
LYFQSLDSKTYSVPKRPWEKERISQELKTIGVYGLKNKKEIWRVQYLLGKIRTIAKNLLLLAPTDPRRLFQGEALLKRMAKMGLLSASEMRLEFVLGLTVNQFMERRLQTLLWKVNQAKSIHHARVLINNRHIRYMVIQSE